MRFGAKMVTRPSRTIDLRKRIELAKYSKDVDVWGTPPNEPKGHVYPEVDVPASILSAGGHRRLGHDTHPQ